MNTHSLPQTETRRNTANTYAAKREKAMKMYQSGYRLSQSLYNPVVFFVHKPGGTRYEVTARRCNCYDFRKYAVPCKHVIWLELYLAWMPRLIARAVAGKPVRRQRFSVKHVANWGKGGSGK